MSRSPDSSVTKFQPDILIQRDFKEPDCSESEDFLDILSVQTVTGYICHGTSKTKFFVISICKGIVGILFFNFFRVGWIHGFIKVPSKHITMDTSVK